LDDDGIRAAVKIRNDTVHGFEPSESIAEDLLASVSEVLERFVTRASVKLESAPIVPLSLEYGPDGFTAHGVELRGASVALPQGTWRVKQPLTTGAPHMLDADGISVALSPWLAAKPAMVVGEWNIFLYDGIKMTARGRFQPSDPLQYLDMTNAERHLELDPGPTWCEVSNWFRQLA
jgi:hypothetical protein